MSDEQLSVTGALAAGVAGELARPLRALREVLAELVDSLDDHIGNATGPTPLPWKRVGRVRDTLADAYLQAREIARLAGDLAGAVAPSSQVAAPADVNKAVGVAMNLARHRVPESTDMFMDFGTLPAVRTIPSAISLAVGWAIATAGDGTRGATDGAISVQTRRDGDEAVITVADNGRRDSAAATRAADVVRALVAPAGGHVVLAHDPETGTSMEVRLRVG